MDWSQIVSLAFQVVLAVFAVALTIATVYLGWSANRYAKATKELVEVTRQYTQSMKQMSQSTEHSARAMEKLVQSTEFSAEATKQMAQSTSLVGKAVQSAVHIIQAFLKAQQGDNIDKLFEQLFDLDVDDLDFD